MVIQEFLDTVVKVGIQVILVILAIVDRADIPVIRAIVDRVVIQGFQDTPDI